MLQSPPPPAVKRARKSLPPVSASEGVAKMFGQAETPETLLDQLLLTDHFGFFVQPVDVQDVQDYHLFVKEPMDLSAMLARLHGGQYLAQEPKNLFGFDVEVFERDLTLISQNCLSYNSQDSVWAHEARRLEQEGLALVHQFVEVVLEPQATMKVRKRVPLYRLGHLSLNSKLLRTLKPESRMLRALLHNLQRLDWDGLFLIGGQARKINGSGGGGGGGGGSSSRVAVMSFEEMHGRIDRDEYGNMDFFVTDFNQVVESRFEGNDPAESKQAARIRDSANVILLGQFSLFFSFCPFTSISTLTFFSFLLSFSFLSSLSLFLSQPSLGCSSRRR